VSPGVSRGRILVLGKPQAASVTRRVITEEQVADEIQRLEQALLDTRHQVLAVQRQVTEGLGAEEAGIFDAHLLVLEDPALIEEVTRLIRKEHISADFAFQQVAEKYVRTLSAIDDEYLRERSADMRDVTARVVDHLVGRTAPIDLNKLTEPCVLISYDLTPTQTAQMKKAMVKGFATDIGGRTSHTAIMARSMRIPAVVGLQIAEGAYAVTGHPRNSVFSHRKATLSASVATATMLWGAHAARVLHSAARRMHSSG